MAKTKIKRVVKKKELAPTYKVTAIIFGRRYEAKGNSPKEAIENLQIKNAKGRAILIMEKGEIKKERILQPITVFRLFNTGGISREIAIKNASTLFDGI